MKPDKIKLRKDGKSLELSFPGTEPHALSAELLRVHSPSAEVKGHGPGQEVLQWGKLNVAITAIERSGNYAIRLTFDDGHDTGIYSWDYLYDLSVNEERHWQVYLDKLQQGGKTRDPQTQVVKFMEP